MPLLILVAACAPAPSGNGPAQSGRIEISGSSTVEPISALVAEEFSETHPGIAISVEGPGTGDGFQRFCAGETDISNASRTIKDEEAALCEQNGIRYVELEIAYDGITVVTNPVNEAISCLSLGDLYALVGPESEGTDLWSDANVLAQALGGYDGFPEAPLNITAPSEESGTFDAFVELALADIGEERMGEEFDRNPTRADYNPSANDNVIVENVGADPNALGWLGFAFAEENADRLNEIAIDGGDGCVSPEIETIAEGEYPLSRSLFIYVNVDKAATKSELAEFVDFYLGDGRSAVSLAGYVDLPDQLFETTVTKWNEATA